MLSWFRKHAKSNAVKALYVLLAITFFGGFGILGNKYLRSERGESSEAEDAVAVVDGEKISAREFAKSYEQAKKSWMARMEKMYGRVPEDMLDSEALKKEVLDNLINRTLLMQEAKKMGVKISQTEVDKEISEIPYFRDQAGKFSETQYRSILDQLGVTPEEFEQEVSGQLKINRVVNLIVAPVQVDEAELKAYYEQMKDEINLSYFMVDAAERYKNLEPSKAEIEEYYQTHLADFDWPEMRKLNYLRFQVADFEKSVQVSEAELKEFYEQGRERYIKEPEKARFRHILVKLDAKAGEADSEKARQKAQNIYQELKSGSDFAELAKKFSDDPGSAAEGGDLGEHPRGSFIPEFEEAGYALKVGEISQPVRSQFGFHIIKLESLTPAEYEPLAKVRDEIKKDLARTKALGAAKEKAEQVQKDCLKMGMEKAAAKYGLKVVTSDWFKKRENILELPESMDLTEQAFYMKAGEISEVISGLDDFYIIEVTEIKDPHQASLEEAYTRIKRNLKPELQNQKAREDARKWLAELKKGASLNELAARAGAKVKETGFFAKGSRMVPEIGLASEDLFKLIFNLNMQNPVPEDIYSSGSKVYVFKLKAEKPADMSDYAKDKEEIGQQLLEKKQQEAFDKFVEDKKQGKVTINQEIYKKIE